MGLINNSYDILNEIQNRSSQTGLVLTICDQCVVIMFVLSPHGKRKSSRNSILTEKDQFSHLTDDQDFVQLKMRFP